MKPLDRVLDLLYPPRCTFCRRLLHDGDIESGVCRECRKILPYVPYGSQRRDVRNVELCVAPMYYEGSVRDSLLRYKFNGLTAYGRIYADFIAKSIDENQISCDIITWVPLSRRRLRKRGYDQARIIAEQLSAELGLPCVKLLDKNVDNPPQSGTGDAQARRANAAGVYSFRGAERISGLSVLLIDDIVTTGSTLAECAKVLRAAGCSAVYAAAAATRRD